MYKEDKMEKYRQKYFECYKIPYIIKREENIFSVEWLLAYVTKEKSEVMKFLKSSSKGISLRLILENTLCIDKLFNFLM